MSILQKMAIANLVLILAYVFFDFFFWKGLTQFYWSGATDSYWYLLFVSFNMNPPITRVLTPVWNLPFLVFCFASALNLYVIRYVQRSKENGSSR